MQKHHPGRAIGPSALPERATRLPWPVLFVILFCCIALTHLTLLHLPYFWDEAGYYVPAALDFFHSGTLIPKFTNAHPPLPNIVLGTLWHLFGFHILVTRLTACTFAAGALTAVFALSNRLLGFCSALLLTALTALYPIWFAQSSLAHADIFAAAFSLAGIGLFLTAPELQQPGTKQQSSSKRLWLAALLFSLSVLSKETAIVQPAVLAGLVLLSLLANHTKQAPSTAHLRWLLALSTCVPVLAAWYTYHFLKTGFIFGNPVFLRYNATANLTVSHVLYALRIRLLHLGWQRNLWVPIFLALACLVLPRRAEILPRSVLITIAALTIGNLVAFSFLGGALLTRYLLPVYPLILLVCIATWRERTGRWPWLAALTALAFVSAIWINPWAFFAPEDNLTYRNMIVVHQKAIHVLEHNFPDATVLTAWPASAELILPELGYTDRPFKVFSVADFTRPELLRVAQQPGRYDTALIFTTHYLVPGFRQFLVTHPHSWRGRRYADQLDLLPADAARLLGGKVVWQDDKNGQWAAIIRFDRSYRADGSPSPSLFNSRPPSRERHLRP